MTPDTTDVRVTELAQWIETELYKPWVENRWSLEEKWQRNIDDFRGLSAETWKAGEGEDWRSKTQFNIARTKMISAFALVCDLVLQGGRIPFRLDPDEGEKARAEASGPGGVEELDNRVEAMTALIVDQLSRCAADREMMKAILSGCVYGEMWLKRYAKTFKTRRFQMSEGTVGEGAPVESRRYEEVQQDEPGLAVKYITPWNLFWDMEAEDWRDDGEGVIERHYLTTHQLRKKIGDAFYSEDAIERAIASAEKRWETGDTSHVDDRSRQSPRETETRKRSKTIRFLECWVSAPRNVVENFERQLMEGGLDPVQLPLSLDSNETQSGKQVWVHVCLADNEVVRYTQIEHADIPYYRSVWEMELDTAEGRGVADNVHDLSIALRGAARAFEDNKKLSANVETAIIPMYFETIPKTRVPGGIYKLSDACSDVRQAMMPIVTPDVGQSLLLAIELFRQLLDEVSQVPKISQGLSPIGQAPDTAYEVSKLAEASGKYIGNITMNVDNGLIEPLVMDYLRWNMMQGGAEGQGAYTVQALGFSSFQDQVLQTQRLVQFFGLAMSNPVALQELKVRDILVRIAKSMRLDPDEVLLTVQEKQAAQQQQQQTQDPMVQLAMAEKQAGIQKQQAEAEKTKIDGGVAVERLKLDRAKAVHEMVRNTPPIDYGGNGGRNGRKPGMAMPGMVQQ